jgi:hypothetical protein
MLRILPAQVLVGLVSFLMISLRPLPAQSEPCPPPASLIGADNPAYNDAMGLQKALEAQGFIIYCIFPTKFSSAFLVWENGIAHSTVEGEANFRTNFGDLDVVFLPKPQTFAELNIEEHRKDSGYLYTFPVCLAFGYSSS